MSREPGPKGVFLLGSLPDFRRDPLGFCTRVARDYGDVAGRCSCCPRILKSKSGSSMSSSACSASA
jgi:hypothetical protein